MLIMQICSIMSCLSSLFIILLLTLFKDLKNTTFTKLIFYIAISDFLGSIGISLGYSYKGTLRCYIQAILTNIFPISSVFWIIMIAYMLTASIFQRQIVDLTNYKLHLFCWGFPILLTFLPLTTNNIGPEGDDRGWCFLRNRSDSPSWSLLFWTIVSFYFWIWAGMILFCCLFIAILYETYRIFRIRSVATYSSNPHNSNTSTKSTSNRNSNGTTQSNNTQITTTSTTNTINTNKTNKTPVSFQNIRSSFYRFGWYPLNMIICWFTPTVYDVYLALHTGHSHSITDENTIFSILANSTPGLLGLLNVLVFVSTNIHLRDKLISLFTSNKSQANQQREGEDSDKSILMKNDVYRESDAFHRQSTINPQHEYDGSDHTGEPYGNPYSPGYTGYDVYSYDYSIGRGSTGGASIGVTGGLASSTGSTGGGFGIGFGAAGGVSAVNWAGRSSVGDNSLSTTQSERESIPIPRTRSDNPANDL